MPPSAAGDRDGRPSRVAQVADDELALELEPATRKKIASRPSRRPR